MTDDPDRAERLERLHGRRSRTHGVIPQGAVRASANVCEAAGCLSLGADRIVDALTDHVVQRGLTDVAVRRVGCLGLCARGPLVDVPEHGRLFERVSPASVDTLVDTLATEPSSPDTPPAFFSRQVKVVLENSGHIDPENLDDYLADDGYRALTTALTSMKPGDVVDEVVRSGLRGRGGAGYPTGLKWATVAKAPGPAGKFVVCNADEGDPGAFMDRSVLESDPHRVLEGMAIAAYAVGASQGYIYVRGRVSAGHQPAANGHQAGQAGSACSAAGIFESPFDFRIDIRIGAGAFVCGEETALIASIEGKRGMPRPRPPYPAEQGLWGCPTLINNVETFANIPPIIRNGRRLVRRASAPRRARGPRSSRWPARCATPGWSRCRWARTLRRDRRGHRRRRRRRRHDQGGADRRPVRRLHPGRAPRHAGRLRVAGRSSARSWARAA